MPSSAFRQGFEDATANLGATNNPEIPTFKVREKILPGSYLMCIVLYSLLTDILRVVRMQV